MYGKLVEPRRKGSVVEEGNQDFFIMLCSGVMPVFDTNIGWLTKEMAVLGRLVLYEYFISVGEPRSRERNRVLRMFGRGELVVREGLFEL